jgi:hypothetical protein
MLGEFLAGVEAEQHGFESVTLVKCPADNAFRLNDADQLGQIRKNGVLRHAISLPQLCA